MQVNSEELENVRTTILSLLLARKGGCTLRQLENDYYEIEGKRIPWKDFGYVSLLSFLYSMSKSVQIENKNNTTIIKGIASNKTKHVSMLVAGQKDQKYSVGKKSYKPSHYYPKTAPHRIHIPAEILTTIISLVNDHPDGVNKNYVFQIVQSRMPFANITMKDMEEQLGELSHTIFQTHNKIFPIQSRTKNFDHLKKTNDMSSLESTSKSYNEQEWNSQIVTAGGNEDSDDVSDYNEEDDFQFVRVSDLSHKESVPTTKSTSSFIKETVFKCRDQIVKSTPTVQSEQNESCHLFDHNYNNGAQHSKELNTNVENEKENYWDGKDGEILINERIKFRLEKLVQNHPDGIWCAELPDKYLEEYKIPLNYAELGFNSVREFASQLPEIFHFIQPHSTGDFILYYAKREIPSNKTKENKKANNIASLHQIYEVNDEEALPVTVSLDICKELIPDEMMTIGESVGYISVLDLTENEKPYIEVIVVEVFTPSFFWIQLRKKQKIFKKFMDDLHNFYAMKHQQYIVPPVVLEKGLNCACMYNGIWHRGIIKTVKPDFQVTVMFYDYGTLKTYPREEIHYLHRMFSNLPAQAIPCSLVNTRPCNGSKWSRSATHHFAVRTSQIPLIATVASVNAEDNSMMVTLTDTLEEEDVHINDWLVEQKLAEHGKMVCMKNRNFSFRHYLDCQERFKQKLEISKTCKKAKSTVHNQSLFSEIQSHNSVTLYDSNAEVGLSYESNFNQVNSSKVNSTSHKEINKKLQFLESRDRLQNDFPIKKMRNYTRNSEEKSRLRSLYEKLLHFKQMSHTDNNNNDNDKNDNNKTNNDNQEFNNNTKVEKLSSSGLTLNKSVEQKLHGKSLKVHRGNIGRHNETSDATSTAVTFNNNNKVGEVSSNKYNILDKYSSIPKEYANHFRIQDPENELDINSIKTCTGIYNEQHDVEHIDWSAVCKNTLQKVEHVPQKNVPKISHESTLKRKDNVPLPERCFLKAVYNSSYFSSSDKDICWSPSGNINKSHDTSPLILDNIKKCMTTEPKNITLAIPQKILELLTDKESSTESLLSTSKTMNEIQSGNSLQEISSVSADNSICANDSKVFHIKDSEHNYEDNETNHYCSMEILTPKCKLLKKLSTMQNISNDISDLDSDDLSDSENSTPQNIDSCEEFKNDASIYGSMLNESYSEIHFKDLSSIKTESTHLDVKESSELMVKESELCKKQASEKGTISLKNSISANNIESTKEVILDESTLTQQSMQLKDPDLFEESSLNIETKEELLKESEQVKEPLLSEETEPVPTELLQVEQSVSSDMANETSSIPTFNDINIESDEEEWDVHISDTEFRNMFKNSCFFNNNYDNRLNSESDSRLKIEEIKDISSIENVKNIETYENTEDDTYKVITSDKVFDNEQYLNVESDNLSKESKKSNIKTSAICSEKNSHINNKDIPNSTNTNSTPWKMQGKAKTLVEMLSKVKLMKKDYIEE